MSVLSLPTGFKTPTTIIFSLSPKTMAFESPLNGSIQTTELPGARWRASLTWANIPRSDARILKAWLNSLAGMAGRFYLHDYSHPLPSGTAAGSPLVKGANQTGRTLITDGWSANQSALLLPGDYFSVGEQLCIITQTIASDSSGNATLYFEPPLRGIPADNTAIVTTRPKAIMMLADDKQDKFPVQETVVTSVTIDCLEVF